MKTAVLKRFLKAFVGGGLGAVGALLSVGVTISSLGDAKNLSFALIAAFVSGGLMALEKAITWK